jgi:hypothetical protein
MGYIYFKSSVSLLLKINLFIYSVPSGFI